jgi:quinohemoprotein amine dehydrogenase beta subunit
MGGSVRKALATIPALALGLGLASAATAEAKDYMVTASRPNNMYLIDLETREVVKNCPLPDEFSPAIIQMSPDRGTAYILNHRWENVYGVDLDTCEIVFRAVQSHDDMRVKSIGAMAVSLDGTEVYTVQEPTLLLKDRYQVLDTQFAVFKVADGLDAKPVRTFPVPRRVTTMQTAADGSVYMGGADIFKFDPQTGAMTTAIPNRNWDRPLYGTPDVLAFWPIGQQSDEYLLMYTAPVFTDSSFTELADFVWGYSRVDLETGATTIADFASLEVLMFSGITDPRNHDILYGVYTQLSKHDLKNKTLIKRVELDHTYYCINVSSDGTELYVGGTNNDIAIYDSETLERLGTIALPGGGDMGTATLQVFSR